MKNLSALFLIILIAPQFGFSKNTAGKNSGVIEIAHARVFVSPIDASETRISHESPWIELIQLLDSKGRTKVSIVPLYKCMGNKDGQRPFDIDFGCWIGWFSYIVHEAGATIQKWPVSHNTLLTRSDVRFNILQLYDSGSDISRALLDLIQGYVQQISFRKNTDSSLEMDPKSILISSKPIGQMTNVFSGEEAMAYITGYDMKVLNNHQQFTAQMNLIMQKAADDANSEAIAEANRRIKRENQEAGGLQKCINTLTGKVSSCGIRVGP